MARTGSGRQLRRAGVVVAPRAAALCWAAGGDGGYLPVWGGAGAAAGAASGRSSNGDDCGATGGATGRQLRRAGAVAAPSAAALYRADSPAQPAMGCRSGAARKRLLGRLLGAAATGIIVGRPGAALAGSCGVSALWKRRERRPYVKLSVRASLRLPKWIFCRCLSS